MVFDAPRIHLIWCTQLRRARTTLARMETSQEQTQTQTQTKENKGREREMRHAIVSNDSPLPSRFLTHASSLTRDTLSISRFLTSQLSLVQHNLLPSPPPTDLHPSLTHKSHAIPCLAPTHSVDDPVFSLNGPNSPFGPTPSSHSPALPATVFHSTVDSRHEPSQSPVRPIVFGRFHATQRSSRRSSHQFQLRLPRLLITSALNYAARPCVAQIKETLRNTSKHPQPPRKPQTPP